MGGDAMTTEIHCMGDRWRWYGNSSDTYGCPPLTRDEMVAEVRHWGWPEDKIAERLDAIAERERDRDGWDAQACSVLGYGDSDELMRLHAKCVYWCAIAPTTESLEEWRKEYLGATR